MAITLKNCASDMANSITGQSIGGETLTLGTNLFIRRIHPQAWSLSVVLLNIGGRAPEGFISTTRSATFYGGVQCVVYAGPGEDGFATGEGVARGLLGYFQQIGSSLSGYLTVLASESSPIPAYDSETDRHFWSINLEASYTA
jgi:hypothetical protein